MSERLMCSISLLERTRHRAARPGVAARVPRGAEGGAERSPDQRPSIVKIYRMAHPHSGGFARPRARVGFGAFASSERRELIRKENVHMHVKAYSVASATSPFARTDIARRDPTPHDVQLEILFCGICHSDLHTARNEWKSVMPTVYPCVPGHEIVGRVTRVGGAVTKFRPGDLAAVGCLVDSDRACPECQAGQALGAGDRKS